MHESCYIIDKPDQTIVYNTISYNRLVAGLKDNENTPYPRLAVLWRRMKVLEIFSKKSRNAVEQFVEVIAEINKAQQKAS